jgi:hypothetical protein
MKLNPGTYFGTLNSVHVGKSERKGSPYIGIVFDVGMAWNGAAWQQISPEQRTVRMYLTDAALPYTMEKLAKMGFQGDFQNPQFVGELVEKGSQLVCQHEPYLAADGTTKMSEKWEFPYSGGGNDVESPETSELLNFNAAFASYKSTSAAPSSPPPTPPAATPNVDGSPAPTGRGVAPAPADGDDLPHPDDIPF